MGRKFLIVTDHKALVSLLNGNNKKEQNNVQQINKMVRSPYSIRFSSRA